MHSTSRCLTALCLLFGLTAAAASSAQEQAPAAVRQVDPAAQPSRHNQTIERIRTEDAGSRIDELRVGGQTQSISVQPKNDMPAYEVRPGDVQAGPSSGMRVWNFLKF